MSNKINEKSSISPKKAITLDNIEMNDTHKKE